MKIIQTPRDGDVLGKLFGFLEAAGVTIEQTEDIIAELSAEVERQKRNLHSENTFKFYEAGGIHNGK